MAGPLREKAAATLHDRFELQWEDVVQILIEAEVDELKSLARERLNEWHEAQG